METPVPTTAHPDDAAGSYAALLERVRHDGAYPTRERAEEAVRHVLGALGNQLVGDERVELAARLPVEAATVLTSQIPATTPLSGWQFVKELADRRPAGPATTRWDVGTVLSAVAQLAGPELTIRVIHQLPPGYALLFGHSDLTHGR
ncbi:DUF2267 domain-containing protein [Streptomyces sp. NPDC056716]|uniref:DUF2267 domain-containing protein n=1 Tax=unclassified Streptomyces TaxID=2593676 RepID=UPI00367BA2D0